MKIEVAGSPNKKSDPSDLLSVPKQSSNTLLQLQKKTGDLYSDWTKPERFWNRRHQFKEWGETEVPHSINRSIKSKTIYKTVTPLTLSPSYGSQSSPNSGSPTAPAYSQLPGKRREDLSSCKKCPT